METLHNISTARNKSHFRLRSALILAGIVIAIICSLVSLKDIHSAKGAETRALGSIGIPAFVNTDFLVNAALTDFGF